MIEFRLSTFEQTQNRSFGSRRRARRGRRFCAPVAPSIGNGRNQRRAPPPPRSRSGWVPICAEKNRVKKRKKRTRSLAVVPMAARGRPPDSACVLRRTYLRVCVGCRARRRAGGFFCRDSANLPSFDGVRYFRAMLPDFRARFRKCT